MNKKQRKMKKISSCFAAIGMMVSLVACKGGSGDYDASGVFETTEVTVSARGTGEIMRFDIASTSRKGIR